MAKSQAEKWGGWDLNQIFCFSTWPHTVLGALEGYTLHTHMVCVYNVCIGCVCRGVYEGACVQECVKGCVQGCVCRSVCAGACVQECVQGVCAGGCAGVCVQGVCAGCV